MLNLSMFSRKMSPHPPVVCASGDTKLDAAVNNWLSIDKNQGTYKEVTDDVLAENWDKLRKTMLKRQRFGTAGMRGRMGAGFNCMNDVVIIQTAQGLCSYLKKQSCHDKLAKGIVVGYDGRHNSKRFARLTTRVFITANIQVHLFFVECPTPLVAYATTHVGAAAGVMVTASHNPKEDNGYKVYWSTGSQIISPHDENLQDEILQCLEIPEEHWDATALLSDEMVLDCYHEVLPGYFATIRNNLHEDVLEDNKNGAIDVVYSAMHGTGFDYINQAFKAANLKPITSVHQQQFPNAEFPTVTFPNPEEVECLVLSKALAEERGIKLVLANDPDADRLAVAEYDDIKKEWKVFSGNEMGALLGWWLLQQYYKRHPAARADQLYVLSSVVSSKMMRAITQGRAQFVETLTGFKWMGNAALLLQQQGKVPVFAFEEAIGYMCQPEVPDKDGVSAAVHVASLATNLYMKKSSLKQQLRELYKEYGYHLSHNSYYFCDDPLIIQQIFRGIRNYDGPGNYPKKVGSAEIEFVHDLASGVRVPSKGREAHLNVLGTGLDRDYTCGEMIMFRTRDGLSVTVRTSGTEPKIKYYTELVCKAELHTDEEEEKLRSKLKVMVREFIDFLIQPKKYNLKGAPSDDAN